MKIVLMKILSKAKKEPKSKPVDNTSSGGTDELTGGEAMLEDMPDETDTALAKRQAIQSVMKDKDLSAVEKNKKIQDIMAGKVELPKVEAKKPPVVDQEERDSDSESEYSESGSESSQSYKRRRRRFG